MASGLKQAGGGTDGQQHRDQRNGCDKQAYEGSTTLPWCSYGVIVPLLPGCCMRCSAPFFLSCDQDERLILLLGFLHS